MVSKSVLSKFKIECPHERYKDGVLEVESDYHPLSKQDISELLKMASKNWDNAAIVSEVQIRLNQGIVGMTCPRPGKGDIAKKLHDVDTLFMAKYIEGGSPDIVDKFYQIMTKTTK